jgi:predicted dinucleotide-utilizing enzyme
MAALCATEPESGAEAAATVPPAITRRRVGILGFGHLGEYLYTSICTLPEVSARLEIAFVWNRSADKLEGVAEEHRLLNLEEAGSSRWPADVIVEVAHPSITAQYASRLMAAGVDFIVGSPTALADESVEAELRATAASGPRVGGLIIPSGALWGAGDLQASAQLARPRFRHLAADLELSAFSFVPTYLALWNTCLSAVRAF